MMDYKIELVAQALYEAEQSASLWDNEPAICKERFRHYAHNAVDLLKEDIGVLLQALEESRSSERRGRLQVARSAAE
jgi:phage terminase Nu1 subunit (DNA packaging protein)